MSRYVKSTTDNRELSKSLRELKNEFQGHKKVIERNNKELAKVNAEVELRKEQEIKLLQQKLKSLESSTQWVQNDEPAVKLNSEDMLKKLNIL